MEHMTEDELIAWEDQHDHVRAWSERWALLTMVLGIGQLLLAITGAPSDLWLRTIGSAGVALLVYASYAREHLKMHAEVGK